jgi:hypothetical protein
MTIKIDLASQVRQTVLPQWKPLLPLFEAVMNSFQAIKEANLPPTIPGRITIEVEQGKRLEPPLQHRSRAVPPPRLPHPDIAHHQAQARVRG